MKDKLKQDTSMYHRELIRHCQDRVAEKSTSARLSKAL